MSDFRAGDYGVVQRGPYKQQSFTVVPAQEQSWFPAWITVILQDWDGRFARRDVRISDLDGFR